MRAWIRSLPSKAVHSPGTAALLTMAALLALMARPTVLSALLVVLTQVWLAWAWVRGDLAARDRTLMGVLLLLLAAASAFGLQRAREARAPDSKWEARTERRLDAAARTAETAFTRLVEEARDRGRRALEAEADLESLSAPIELLGFPLDVGISLWSERGLETWAGSVTGPRRLPPQDRPLLVDHNFRRYLTVSTVGEEGRICRVDVALGLTGSYFADLGSWPDPAAPLREATGVGAELLADPPRVGRGGFDRVVGVPADDPWVWVGLDGPRAVQERDERLGKLAQRMAWSLLLALLIGLVRVWRWWPDTELDVSAAARALVAVAVLFALRWQADVAALMEHALPDGPHALALLKDEAYFTTLRGGGLFRMTADFLLTAATVSLAAAVLLPAWLHLVSARRGWLWALGSALLLTGAGPAVLAAIAQLQELVAQGANPTLVGVRAPFFSPAFLALHLAMLLTLLPLVAWVLLGWERWLRERGRWGRLVGLAAAALVVALQLRAGHSWVSALWLGLLPLLAMVLRPALREAALSRRLVVGLFAMLWFAGVQSQGLQAFYTDDREEVAEERAVGRLRPDDPWRPYLLEDVLRRLSTDREALREFTDPERPRGNLAFEIWLTTELSRQGSPSCLIQVVGRDGEVRSRFDFGLPYEVQTQRVVGSSSLPASGRLRMGTLEIGTDRGRFLVYRGVLDLSFYAPEGDLGELIIDLPYATLDPASADGDFRGLVETLGLPDARPFLPRQAFEAGELSFAKVDSTGVTAASSPRLLGLDPEALPEPGAWTTLERGGERIHLGRVRWGSRSLAVAFPEPTLSERILDASRLAMLYLVAGAVLFLLVAGLRGLGLSPSHRAPELMGRIGFQERLLGAILLVVLLPVLVLGVVQERRATAGSVRSGLQEVDQRLDTAVNLLGSDLDRMTQALLRGDYVQQLLTTGEPAQWRDFGPFGRLELMVFSPDGEILLDESLRDLGVEEARRFLGQVEGGELYLESFGNSWFVGRLYHVTAPDGGRYPVFARRQVTDEDLSRLARVVGADLSLYDGPWAVVSSQDYLLEAGLTVPVMPAQAGRAIFDEGGRRVVEADRQDGLVVARGYLALDGPGEARRGVLEARLFARATETARERQRARLFLLGLSSLALVMAVAVGLLLAGRIVDPIQALVAATRRIGRGELDVRLPDRGSDEIGELVRSFNRMTDDLRGSRAELAARQSFLEDMLGNLSVGVFVLDASGEVVESNAAARELFAPGRERLLERVAELGPPPEVSEIEVVAQSEAGPRTLRSVVTPTRLESQENGWLVLVDDVTELLASRRLALYAQMARQVAHEVKNPLTPIQLSAQMVRQACDDGHPDLDRIVDENVGRIEMQVERLREIASEFSLLGREELDDVEAVDLRPVLEEVAGAYPQGDDRPSITLEAPDSLWVSASRKGLVKILSNLIQNGLQAMGGGAGRLELRAVRDEEGVRVEVLDEGPGIDPEVADRLFEPYFSTKSTGTGLGLVISRSLAEKMGGRLSLGNRSDRTGARATLVLAEADGG